MAFEDGAFSLIIAIIACSGVFAYLGINVGGANITNVKGTNHFPLKLFFMIMSLTFLLGAVGTSLLVVVDTCGLCHGLTPYCPTGECTIQEQRVVDVGMWVMAVLTFAWLFIVGYFIVLFIRWVLYYLNMNRTKKAVLESDYEK
jgi:hypothetical protein